MSRITRLDIRRRVLGPEHPRTLTSMNNLAVTLSAQGDWAAARKLQEETLNITQDDARSGQAVASDIALLDGSSPFAGDAKGDLELQSSELKEFFRRMSGYSVGVPDSGAMVLDPVSVACTMKRCGALPM